MIYFVADYVSMEAAARRLNEGYSALGDRVRFIEYSQLLTVDCLPGGSYIFTGTTSWNPEQAKLARYAEKVMDSSEGPFRIFNRPSALTSRSTNIHRWQAGRAVSAIHSEPSNYPCQLRTVDRHRPLRPACLDQNELAKDIAQVILEGLPLDSIRLVGSEVPTSQALLIGTQLVSTSGPGGLPTWIHAIGFDVVSLEYQVNAQSPSIIVASDHLTDILPAIGSNTSLSDWLCAAYLQLEFLGPDDPTPLPTSMDELAAVLGISRPA